MSNLNQANSLALILKIKPKHKSQALPLALGVGGDTPSITPLKKKRRMLPSFEMTAKYDNAQSLALCQHHTDKAKAIASQFIINLKEVQNIASCQNLTVRPFISLANCQNGRQTDIKGLVDCAFVWVEQFALLANCQKGINQKAIGFGGCTNQHSVAVIPLITCQKNTAQSVLNLADGLGQIHKSKTQASCQSNKTDKAVSVPCRYYPIPKPPTPPTVQVCQVRPPSNALPFVMRAKVDFSVSALPLALKCYHDKDPDIITPSFKSYIMLNTITASIAGIQIDPVSFNIKTDMFSFCWQGSVEITAKDYQRVQAKLAQNKDENKDSLIYMTINGFAFTLMAEEISHHRQFIGDSVSISGRSPSARLSSDYAVSVPLDSQNYYVSQIAQKQLENLSVVLDNFGIDDWLIPAGVYSSTGKTPIVVMDDLAKSCGGFVYSHPSDAKLSILPKWKVPAWELATANPDRTISLDAIHKMTITTKTNPRYNTVLIVGANQGGIVHREREARDKEAPTQDNILCTQREPIVAQGMAILSDSGKHSQITLDLRLSKKYGLELAKLGEIWQVNDEITGQVLAWKARVVEVAITAKADNSGVVDVMQTVGLDRYDDV